jgi:predicted permease
VAGVPVFYAVLLALALNLLHISVPDVLFRSIKLLGDASVPT